MSEVTVTQDQEWRCFHCGDVFTDKRSARFHFGRNEDSTPACIIKGADGGLLRALRDAEEQADDAIQMMHSESTDAAKAYHRQRCRHTQALTAAEESGYERGLKDGRQSATASTLAALEQAREALTPSGDTKAAYMGEFSFNITLHDEEGEEYPHKVYVPWTTVKEIMAEIAERARLTTTIEELRNGQS